MPHETKPIDYQIKTRRATLPYRIIVILFGLLIHLLYVVIMYAFILFNVYAYQHTHIRTHTLHIENI